MSTIPPAAREVVAELGATAPQMQDLERFGGALEAWSSRINLVGPSALAEFWSRHVLDSAQMLHVEHRVCRWADVGSGAGFPGVILAILLKDTPDAHIRLIESVGKRVGFLREIVTLLNLPAEVIHGRAEQLRPTPAVEVVTARACAPLPRLLEFTAPFFRKGARGLFLKGRGVEAELTDARRSWTFDAQLLPSRTDPEGRLLRIERLARSVR